MTARSRNKGAAGEREVVRLLRGLGIDAERNLEQTRDGGADIVFQYCGVFWIAEVKRRAGLKPVHKRNAWTQVSVPFAASTLQPKRRVVFYRSDREPWQAMYAVRDEIVHGHFDAWKRHAFSLARRISTTKATILDSIY